MFDINTSYRGLFIVNTLRFSIIVQCPTGIGVNCGLEKGLQIATHKLCSKTNLHQGCRVNFCHAFTIHRRNVYCC